MSFWTSVLAVFIADSILAALHYNAIESVIILAFTSVIYLFASNVIDRWHLHG